MQKIYKCEDECCPQLQTSEHLTAMEIMQNLYKKLLQNLYKELLQEWLPKMSSKMLQIHFIMLIKDPPKSIPNFSTDHFTQRLFQIVPWTTPNLFNADNLILYLKTNICLQLSISTPVLLS